MCSVYILFSEKLQKFYIGQTHDIQTRIQNHNATENHNWTKKGKPWEIKLVIPCKNRLVALKVERFIKNQKSKKFINTLINKPELVDDILRKHDR